MPTYEIIRRTTKQHRGGNYTLHIDGIESEYTNDPAQHFQKFLAAGLAEGLALPEATEKANTLADQRSRDVLQRIVDRLRKGVLFAGGAPLGPDGIDAKALPRTQKTRASEGDAVAAFLNRGRLRDLTEDERAARAIERDTVRDHSAEWQKNRKDLIAHRNAQLEKLQSEVATCNRDKLAKLQKRIKRLEAEIAGLHVGVVAASHGFQYAYGQILTKQVDFVNDDLRIVPCMTNTSVDTERDAKDMVSDFTTLDEFDGSGYSSGGLALDSQAVNIDDANDRAEFDAADEVVATLAAGTRAIDGILLISFITNLNGSLPLFWLEFAADQTPGGGAFTFQFNAEGIVQVSG